MEIFPYSLFLLLLYSFIFGVLSGALYDVLRTLRGERASGGRLSGILAHIDSQLKDKNKERQKPYAKALRRCAESLCDVLFFIFLACGIIVLNYYYNSGEIRFFPIASMAAGFWLYRVTLSPLIMRMLTIVLALIGRLLRIVFYPIGLIFAKILKILELNIKKSKTMLAKKKKMRYNRIEGEELIRRSRSGFLNL